MEKLLLNHNPNPKLGKFAEKQIREIQTEYGALMKIQIIKKQNK